MRENIVYAGRAYWLQSTGRYFQSGVKTDAERLLHRRIWSDANGPIPEGYAIHHIDGDWRNNDLANLEAMPFTKHAREHMLERNATPEGRAASLAALEAGQKRAAAWHASPAGIAWHKEHGARTWEGREAKSYTCEVCATQFESRHATGARFCSSACAQRVGVKRYFTLTKPCEKCGAEYVTNRHRPTRFCSYACSNSSRKAA